MTDEHGGPAFPGEYEDGMTLRTYVATSILNGMISSTPIVDREIIDKKKWSVTAVKWADALIAALKETS